VLSIIVPARNNPNFTPPCLGTILHSLTRRNLAAEFILIDDAPIPMKQRSGILLTSGVWP
jgi:hypothetical protein